MTITRPHHPFEGQSLEILRHARMRGRLQFVLILPDGSKSLVPAEWTAHLNWASQKDFKAETLQRFLGQAGALGLQIFITELDVVDRDLPEEIEERDKGIAQAYESYLTAAVQQPALTAVLTWGLTDKYTWLAGRGRRPSGATARVLPLDREYRRKPAWQAMARTFDSRKR